MLIILAVVAIVAWHNALANQHQLNADLFLAVHTRDVSGVESLLKQGAVPNILQDGAERSPLLWAIETGDEAIVRVMLRNGADPNAQGAYGARPLYVAAGKGHQAIFHLLLAYGATPTDLTALLSGAAYSGNVPLVMDVIKMGANPAVIPGALHVAGSAEVAKTLVAAGCPVDAKDGRGRTALHLAASDGNEELVQALLSLGADVEARDASGDTPLDLAKRYGHGEVVLLLGSGRKGASPAGTSTDSP